MPFLKGKLEKSEPLWHKWDKDAQKEGLRDTVYYVNKDEYRGMWKDNKRHGRGRHLYYKTKSCYNGYWINDNREGKGLLAVLVGDQYRTVYYGEWFNDKKHGQGINYYDHENDSYYEGDWECDERHGHGKMFHPDGSIYDGDWLNDNENGRGILYMANGDVYEGAWKDGKKHGDGRYHFKNRGQMLIGTWSDGTSKCGEMMAYDDQSASNPFKYPIPSIELVDAKSVIREAQTAVKSLEIPLAEA